MINTRSVLLLLLAWCFSARASGAKVQIMNPCLYSCFRVNLQLIPLNDSQPKWDQAAADIWDPLIIKLSVENFSEWVTSAVSKYASIT